MSQKRDATYRVRSRAEGWDPNAYQLARIASGMTWEALADRCADLGLPASRSSLHSWSQDHTPRGEWLPTIARALGCKQSALLTSRSKRKTKKKI